MTRRAHTITADIELPERSGKASGNAYTDGVIIADGGRWGGFALYVKDGKLSYVANAHGNQTGHIVANTVLPAGKLQARFRQRRSGWRRPHFEDHLQPLRVPGHRQRSRLARGRRLPKPICLRRQYRKSSGGTAVMNSPPPGQFGGALQARTLEVAVRLIGNPTTKGNNDEPNPSIQRAYCKDCKD